MCSNPDSTHINQFIILDSPRDVSSDNQKVTYATVGSRTQLNCSVRSFPVISIHNIKIYHTDSYLDSNQMKAVRTNDQVDEVLIRLIFEKISVSDFGIYRVELDNGVGGISTIEMKIEEHGGYIFGSL